MKLNYKKHRLRFDYVLVFVVGLLLIYGIGQLLFNGQLDGTRQIVATGMAAVVMLLVVMAMHVVQQINRKSKRRSARSIDFLDAYTGAKIPQSTIAKALDVFERRQVVQGIPIYPDDLLVNTWRCDENEIEAFVDDLEQEVNSQLTIPEEAELETVRDLICSIRNLPSDTSSDDSGRDKAR